MDLLLCFRATLVGQFESDLPLDLQVSADEPESPSDRLAVGILARENDRFVLVLALSCRAGYDRVHYSEYWTFAALMHACYPAITEPPLVYR